MVAMLALMLVASVESADALHMKEMAGLVTLATGSEGVHCHPTQMAPEKEAGAAAVLTGLVSPGKHQPGARDEQRAMHVDLAVSFKRGLPSTESLLLLSLTTSGGPRCAQMPHHQPLPQMPALLPLQLPNQPPQLAVQG